MALAHTGYQTVESRATWHLGFTLRVLLPPAAIVILATACAYPYYSYPYWYYPSGYGSVAVVEEPLMIEERPPIQREVVYPNGKYVLYGDGASQPWYWAWVPAALAPPLSPPR